MTNNFKKLPIGIENFKELREDNFYYVDKTQLIEKLLQNWGKANLFTRPRRFGKSLTMSMLKHFFEIGCDPSIFDGLYISQNQKLCQQYMGKFPVISISLKGIHSETYSKAKAMLIKVINEEARRFQFLLNSGNLTEIDKELFLGLLKQDMNEDTLVYSLRELTELLNKHFQQKVIVLIDEYDVPLAKADEMGYYNEMVLLIRNLFENVLKTNDYLYFSVLTGCLRVAKESIFTGLNNFKVYPITNVAFDEYFGFTDLEVKEILEYYHQTGQYETVKTWYDGYHFGDVDIYCPWDVICFCEDHRESPDLAPQNYWLNTSGNQIIRHFIENMGSQSQLTKTDLELLLNGSSVQRTIRQELTYKDLYSSPEILWSALFMTGYLTQKGLPDGDRYDLVIPNQEIRNIITTQLLTLFTETIKNDGKDLEAFCSALFHGNAPEVEHRFTAYMQKTISIRDTFVQKPTKENFYHGILLGILGYKSGWTVRSNKESGNGFSDIFIQIDDSDLGIIIEVKYSENDDLKSECKKALQQISQKNYTEGLYQNGIHHILKYGIVCQRKRCCVLLEKE